MINSKGKIFIIILVAVLLALAIYYFGFYQNQQKQKDFLINNYGDDIRPEFTVDDISMIKITELGGVEELFALPADDFDKVFNYISSAKLEPFGATDLMPLDYSVVIVLKDDRFFELMMASPYFMYMDKSHYHHKAHLQFSNPEFSNFIKDTVTNTEITN